MKLVEVNSTFVLDKEFDEVFNAQLLENARLEDAVFNATINASLEHDKD